MNLSLRSSICLALTCAAAFLVFTGCAGETGEEESEEHLGDVSQALARACTYHDALGGHPGSQTLANVGGNWVWQKCK